MYTLNDDQIASIETFIGKIPDSLIKSRVEKWLAEIEPTRRVTGEQMEQFVSFATHLPKELQNFPQSFASSAKNANETTRREDKGEVAEKAELISLVDESIADVEDVDAPDNEEETVHTLGKLHKTKSKGKAKSKGKK